jgi:hypothetical protein
MLLLVALVPLAVACGDDGHPRNKPVGGNTKPGTAPTSFSRGDEPICANGQAIVSGNLAPADSASVDVVNMTVTAARDIDQQAPKDAKGFLPVRLGTGQDTGNLTFLLSAPLALHQEVSAQVLLRYSGARSLALSNCTGEQFPSVVRLEREQPIAVSFRLAALYAHDGFGCSGEALKGMLQGCFAAAAQEAGK